MKNTNLSTDGVYERATCPYCFGPLKHVVKGKDAGEHQLFTVCDGPCQKVFLPPWPERQWCEPESRPIPTELAIVFNNEADCETPARRAAGLAA